MVAFLPNIPPATQFTSPHELLSFSAIISPSLLHSSMKIIPFASANIPAEHEPVAPAIFPVL